MGNVNSCNVQLSLFLRIRNEFVLQDSDGDDLIDELKIYDRALAGDEVLHACQAAQPKSPPRQWRKLPQIPAGPKRFGAVYCRLNFYPECDALWRIGDYPDLVVGFDEGDYKMVFRHGIGYNMNLVTENGRWVGDQSAEEGGRSTIGCCEHMSDKQCRYALVRVIENHDAREEWPLSGPF